MRRTQYALGEMPCEQMRDQVDGTEKGREVTKSQSMSSRMKVGGRNAEEKSTVVKQDEAQSALICFTTRMHVIWRSHSDSVYLISLNTSPMSCIARAAERAETC